MAAPDSIRFCPICGEPVIQREVEGRLRPFCQVCDRPFFQDPKVAAAVLVESEGKVLLIKRANVPERGKWTLPAGFVDAFKATRTVLREDPRLVLDTLDKAGRFIAFEKVGGFIFFRHRTILDIKLESLGPEETKITLRLNAEDYEMGGLTRPAGWYPSSEVDTFLGEDIMNLIEREIAKPSE